MRDGIGDKPIPFCCATGSCTAPSKRGNFWITDGGYGTLVKTSQDSRNNEVLGGESPPLGVLARTRKLSLGQYREVLSEGDVVSRETHKWLGRPKCESVKHDG